MRQIKHAVRCLSLALVLVAAFATLSPALQASAKDQQPGWSFLEAQIICGSPEEGGGHFWWIEFDDGTLIYGCDNPGGGGWYCAQAPGGVPRCSANPVLYAPAGDVSNVPAGEASDQPAPAPSGPTGSSDAGYESKPYSR
jgi:hypothetical protein